MNDPEWINKHSWTSGAGWCLEVNTHDYEDSPYGCYKWQVKTDEGLTIHEGEENSSNLAKLAAESAYRALLMEALEEVQ